MKAWGTVAGALRMALGGLADLFLPDACAACGSPEPAGGGLCEPCGVRLLGLVAAAYCPRCGAGLGPNVPPDEAGCPRCPDPLPRFERVVRLGAYADPLRSLIRRMKYLHQEAMRRRLGAMLGEAVAARSEGTTLDVVLPVPMHWRRRLSRGHDHARVLAGAVARRLGVPLGHELIRVRHTPPQALLPRTRRAENVRGAFALTSPACVEGARVLLVDDVATTGATAGEAANAAGRRHRSRPPGRPRQGRTAPRLRAKRGVRTYRGS
jgi:ComF family protein